MRATLAEPAQHCKYEPSFEYMLLALRRLVFVAIDLGHFHRFHAVEHEELVDNVQYSMQEERSHIVH